MQEIPPRYPKGLFKSCSPHIAYLNTDSWSSESTHLGHCANPHSPLKKKNICTPPTLDLLYCWVCQGKLFHFGIQKPKHKVEPTHMESCSATLCIQRKKNIRGTNSEITTPTDHCTYDFFFKLSLSSPMRTRNLQEIMSFDKNIQHHLLLLHLM